MARQANVFVVHGIFKSQQPGSDRKEWPVVLGVFKTEAKAASFAHALSNVYSNIRVSKNKLQ
jgi:hypothetical protein